MGRLTRWYTLWGMRTSFGAAIAASALSLLVLTAGCSSDTAAVEKVGADEAVTLIESGEPTVIDVRTPAEFAAGHVAGAQNIEVTAGDFESLVGRLPKDGEYVVYCQTGNRSGTATEKMADLGFTDLVDGGGIVDLQASGAEIVTGG